MLNFLDNQQYPDIPPLARSEYLNQVLLLQQAYQGTLNRFYERVQLDHLSIFLFRIVGSTTYP